jgi:hypothetical protein
MDSVPGVEGGAARKEALSFMENLCQPRIYDIDYVESMAICLWQTISQAW